MHRPVPSPDPDTVLGALRRETAAVHRELDRSLRVARPGASAEDWQRFLRATLGWVEPLEAAFQAAGAADWIPEAEVRFAKTAWLAADLEELGDSPEAVTALPRAATPGWADPASAFGAAYVVEGSTLGGRLLRELAASALPDARLRYWEGYGAATGRRWREMVASLERFGAERPGEVPRLLATATSTFETIGSWLDERGCWGEGVSPGPDPSPIADPAGSALQ